MLRPRLTRQDGHDRYIVDGMKRTVPLAFVDGAGVTPSQRRAQLATKTFEDVRPGAYDGAARQSDMDRDGIAAEIIYASLGMVLFTHPDPLYRDACMKAYNRWLETFCGAMPGALVRARSNTGFVDRFRNR